VAIPIYYAATGREFAMTPAPQPRVWQ